MSLPIDDDTTPRADGSIASAAKRSVSLPKPPKHRSEGLRHALATERGLANSREKNTGRNRMKRQKPSMPKLPPSWND